MGNTIKENCILFKKDVTKIKAEVKRPRGRPRKVVPNNIVEPVKRPRGRPRKVASTMVGITAKKTYAEIEEPIDMSNVKIGKFIGHCPKCKISLTNKDAERGSGGKIIVCIRCGVKTEIEKLIDVVDRDRPKNKKEYLEESMSVHNYHDHGTALPHLHSEELPSEVINVVHIPENDDEHETEFNHIDDIIEENKTEEKE